MMRTVVAASLARMLPRTKDRRALGAGVLVIGSMLLVGRGVPAWRQWERSQRLAAQESSERLRRAQSSIRAHPSIITMRGELAARLDSLSSTHLHAPSVTIACAALAAMMSDLGDESAIRVTSISVRPDTVTKAAFTRIAVRVSATGDVEGLADYLRSVESSGQMLAVRELSVAQTDPTAPDSRAELLRFELLVEALARIAPTERAAPTARARGTSSSAPSGQ